MSSGSYERKDWICPWCGKHMKAQYRVHMWNEHGKTMDDYLLISHGLTEWPKCIICGKDVASHGFEFLETCGDINCRNQLVNQRSMESGHNAFLNYSQSQRKEYAQLGRNAQRAKGMPAFGYKTPEQMQKRWDTIRKNNVMAPNPDIEAVIYFLKIPKESRCKIGRTRNLDQRLEFFDYVGLPIAEIQYIKTNDLKSREIENILHQEFKEFRMPMESDKYVEPGDFPRLGRREFYNISIWKDLIRYVKDNIDNEIYYYEY